MWTEQQFTYTHCTPLLYTAAQNIQVVLPGKGLSSTASTQNLWSSVLLLDNSLFWTGGLGKEGRAVGDQMRIVDFVDFMVVGGTG